MTKDEFQRKYHNYEAKNMVEAKLEADKVNKSADGFIVEPQEFSGIGICLMLSTAKSFINGLYPEFNSKADI